MQSTTEKRQLSPKNSPDTADREPSNRRVLRAFRASEHRQRRLAEADEALMVELFSNWLPTGHLDVAACVILLFTAVQLAAYCKV